MVQLFTIVNDTVHGECKITIDAINREMRIENGNSIIRLNFNSNFVRENDLLFAKKANENIEYIIQLPNAVCCQKVFEKIFQLSQSHITEIDDGITMITETQAPTYFSQLITIVNGEIVQNCGYCFVSIDINSSLMKINNGGTQIVIAFNSNFIRENDMLCVQGAGNDEHVLKFSNTNICEKVFEAIYPPVAA